MPVDRVPGRISAFWALVPVDQAPSLRKILSLWTTRQKEDLAAREVERVEGRAVPVEAVAEVAEGKAREPMAAEAVEDQAEDVAEAPATVVVTGGGVMVEAVAMEQGIRAPGNAGASSRSSRS